MLRDFQRLFKNALNTCSAQSSLRESLYVGKSIERYAIVLAPCSYYNSTVLICISPMTFTRFGNPNVVFDPRGVYSIVWSSIREVSCESSSLNVSMIVVSLNEPEPEKTQSRPPQSGISNVFSPLYARHQARLPLSHYLISRAYVPKPQLRDR